MNILIDIIHPADINFYKNAVKELGKQHSITFTVLKRGKVPQIVAKEFKGYKQIVFGRHYSPFIGKLYSIAIRQLVFLWLFMTRKYNVVSSFGFYPGFLAPLFGIKAVHFHDDKEYKFNYTLAKAYSSRFVTLCDDTPTKKTRVVKSYKELAYLQPLKTDDAILKKLNLKKDKYVYVREVASVSLNYKDEEFFNYQKTFDALRKKGYTIVFSAEKNTHVYTGVQDFTGIISMEEMMSIKKHAALIITSGDTVLREGALLGTPTIYTSSRDMNVNKQLLEKGLFTICLDEESLKTSALKLLSKKKSLQKIAKSVREECEDITKVIIEEIQK